MCDLPKNRSIGNSATRPTENHEQVYREQHDSQSRALGAPLPAWAQDTDHRLCLELRLQVGSQPQHGYGTSL